MPTRILVVDDEPVIGKLLLYQLTELGYQVSYVQNGLLALQRVLAERPDLVLLDVMMPLISGWEVCRQIRACSSVPVIMLTAKSGEVDLLTGIQAGADDYVTKPFTMAQLRARIEVTLRRPGQFGAQRLEPASPPPAAEPVTPPLSDEPAVAPEPHPPQPVQTGAQVRAARLAQGFTLHHSERACHIRWEFLQAIEQENWEYIPRRELARTITHYGAYLQLDVAALIARAKSHNRRSLALRYLLLALIVMGLVALGFYWI